MQQKHNLNYLWNVHGDVDSLGLMLLWDVWEVSEKQERGFLWHLDKWKGTHTVEENTLLSLLQRISGTYKQGTLNNRNKGKLDLETCLIGEKRILLPATNSYDNNK